MNDEIEAMIARMREFGPLPQGAAERIRPLLRVRVLEKGAYFVRAGERTDKAAFLARGWLRYFYVDAEGREFIRYFCDGNDFVAALPALISRAPSAYSIQALTPSTLVEFRYEDWLALVAEAPAWALIHAAIQARALVRAEERERSLVLDDAATRYRRFLEEFPGAEETLRQYDVASYLGISPASLSRLRGKKRA